MHNLFVKNLIFWSFSIHQVTSLVVFSFSSNKFFFLLAISLFFSVKILLSKKLVFFFLLACLKKPFELFRETSSLSLRTSKNKNPNSDPASACVGGPSSLSLISFSFCFLLFPFNIDRYASFLCVVDFYPAVSRDQKEEHQTDLWRSGEVCGKEETRKVGFTAAARGSVRAFFHLKSTTFWGGVMAGEVTFFNFRRHHDAKLFLGVKIQWSIESSRVGSSNVFLDHFIVSVV